MNIYNSKLHKSGFSPYTLLGPLKPRWSPQCDIKEAQKPGELLTQNPYTDSGHVEALH